MIRKLRRKFLAAAMISTFFVLAVIIGTVNILNYQSVVMQADRTLDLLASEKGQSMFGQDGAERSFPEGMDAPEGGREIPDGEQPAPSDDGMGGFSPEFRFQVRFFSVTFNEAGEPVSVDIERIAAVDGEEAKALAGEALSKGRTTGFLGTYRYLITREKETTIRFLDCERELSTFRNFLLVSGSISLAGLIAVFVLLLLTSGRIVRPIAESYEKQKRFITDAGHEIKTPITIIEADSEVLEMEQGESEWLRDIRVQTKRLTDLTNDLIYLSRMDEEQARIDRADFDLSDRLREAVQSFQALARKQGKEIAASIEPNVIVNGDEKGICQLISILLDNAVKYAPDRSRIEASLSGSGKNIRLEVNNPAEDLQKGNRNEIFERFYRADPSRKSEGGGYGLGLSIAKAVVGAHKGKISAVSDGSSLTIEAVLPIRISG